MPLFSKNNKKCLGIDIGSTSIKIVELAQGEDGFSLNNYGIASMKDITGRAIRSKNGQGLISSKSAIAETIEKIIKEAGIKTKKTIFSIPDYSSFFTSFEIPKMKKSEVESAIQHQARQRIPLPLNEVTLDWTLAKLRKKDGEELIEVLLLAVPNETIKAYREVANKTGLKVGALDAETFGLAKIYGEEEKTIAVVDIGDQSTTINIIEDGIPKHSHSINTSGKDFTEEVAILPDINYNDDSVEEDKNKENDNEGDDSPTKVAKKVRESLTEELVRKIERVRLNYEEDQGKVDDIIIIGGGVNFRDVHRKLKEELSAKYGKPFNKIDYPSELEPMMDGDLSSLLSVAAGMALEGFKSEK